MGDLRVSRVWQEYARGSAGLYRNWWVRFDGLARAFFGGQTDHQSEADAVRIATSRAREWVAQNPGRVD